MKTLNYTYAEYGLAFWDQDDKPICYIHENDSDFKAEHMSQIFEHFKIGVKHKANPPASVLKWIRDYEEEFEDDILEDSSQLVAAR